MTTCGDKQFSALTLLVTARVLSDETFPMSTTVTLSKIVEKSHAGESNRTEVSVDDKKCGVLPLLMFYSLWLLLYRRIRAVAILTIPTQINAVPKMVNKDFILNSFLFS